MEITHIIIDGNFIYIFLFNSKNKLELYVYNIGDFVCIKKIINDNILLELYMNSICLYNNKFYFVGGFDTDLKIPNFFENIIVTQIDLSNIEIIKTIPSLHNNFPLERLFLYNNNAIIKDNIVYMCGGVINEEYTENFEYYIMQDFWKLDLETKKWDLIIKNISNLNDENQENKNFSYYLEIADCGENILIRRKYDFSIFYLYNIAHDSWKKINITNVNKILFCDLDLSIYTSFYNHNNIYFITKSNVGSFFNIEYSIERSEYRINHLCDENYYEHNITFYKNKVYFFNKNQIKRDDIKNNIAFYNYKHTLYDSLANKIRYCNDLLMEFKNNKKYIPAHIVDDIECLNVT